MKVIKRDGHLVDFDGEKIKVAILKAMKYGSGIIKEDIASDISKEIYEENKGKESISIKEIEDAVFDKLVRKKQKLTAKAYEGYRAAMEYRRKSNTTDKDVIGLLNRTNSEVASSNSNKNATLFSTQRDLVAGEVSKDLMRRRTLPIRIKEAHDDGILHYHDLDYAMQRGMTNCCLVNIEDMLNNGTAMNGIKVEPPNSFQTACTVITQIMAAIASNQYGGQSMDIKHLGKYLRKTYEKAYSRYVNKLKKSEEEAKELATDAMMEELKSGVQTIQYQVITISSSNGQSPFVTLFLNLEKGYEYEKEVALIIEEILRQRMKGVKNKAGHWVTPTFPKLVYVLDEHNCLKGGEYDYLTKLAVECSAKRMYPDYVSAKIMRERYEGNVFSPMGCVDGKELVTYKFKNRLYVESFERMWDNLSDYFDVKSQDGNNTDFLYMDLAGVEIYDTEKGLINTHRIIRNLSDRWLDVNLSNGRRLLCTDDHPFHTVNRGRILARDLKADDEVIVNSHQYSEENFVFNDNKAWLLGFMLCDGCYQSNHISASIALESENDIEEAFKARFKESFGLETKTIVQSRGEKGEYKDLSVRSNGTNKVNDVINYFTVKFRGINKKDRQIPVEVFEWNYSAKLSFMAGMIDADGYLNEKSKAVQIGSTNKELALQQLALAQSLGMPARIYHNHYSRTNKELIRYRVEFYPTDHLLAHIVCDKKLEKAATAERQQNFFTTSKIVSLNAVEKVMNSYDVTTESDHFEVSGIYSHNCRSFLSPWKDENGNYKFEGRLNLGVVSLNLPQIAILSKGDEEAFWSILDTRLGICNEALMFRYSQIKGTVSDVSPIHWQEGGIARLKTGETIDKYLENGYATISLGYIGVYETTKMIKGVSHTTPEGKEFAMRLMKKLKSTVDTWKKETGIGFGLYGTPAESLCYRFAKIDLEKFGSIEDVTDKGYYTNSFHVDVREKIDAFSKLQFEEEFQKISTGGCISYVEIPNSMKNTEALEELVRFIYDSIQYAEFNTKLDDCMECAFSGEMFINSEGKFECPQCGNTNRATMNVTRRSCGYLGSNEWNDGKMKEFKLRYVHIGNEVEEEDQNEIC